MGCLDVGTFASDPRRLQQVIVHRPGLELTRLTPANAPGLLFDDILWAKKAREEHDAFAGVLEDRGIRVHHFDQLFAETLAIPAASGRSQVQGPYRGTPVRRTLITGG